ncbi:MAG: hypothetical protein GY869_12555, partial [Planctomycetes bacterium]|nr:hypothetical protein [Planctomycetota bacterium]
TYADAAQKNSPPGYMDGYEAGITNGYAWYEVTGGRQGYMNYFQFCRESTIELSNTKLLPANQLPALWDYNREALLLYMEECLYGIRGLVTGEDVTRTDPLEATITVIGHDFDNSEAVTDPDVGDYHRPIAPGVYDIEVSSFGYISQVIEGISVADSDIAIFNVILEAAASVTLSGTVIDGDSGLPIENAIVEILDSTFPMAETNDDGSYEIPEVFVADYTIRVFAIGYAGLRQEITVTEDNYIFDFELYESVAESFETGQFPTGWQFDGNANWSIDGTEAYDGFYSAKSGDISHNQFTELSITLDIAEAAEISFYRKTSCEEDPDDDYDYLAFQIDGQEMGRWDGESDWAEVFYPVSTGHRTFSWIYSKDGSVSSGQDCAWIDYIIFPPVGLPAPQNLQAIQEEGAVILNWDLPPDPQGLLGYNIYRDGIQINPETVTETTYIDTDFEFGNTYCYITKAVYSEGESGPSNESCLSPILNSPQNLVAVSFVGTSVMLTWQPPVDDRPGSANQSGQPSVRGSSSERTDRRSDAETGFSPAPASRLTRDLTAYNIYRYQQLIDSVSPDLTTYFDNNLNAGEYCYTVTALYDAGESQPSNEDCAFIESTAIEPGDGTSGRPETIALQQNNPNPFNPRGRSDLTTIAYALPAPASITLKIYDAAGREVKTLIDCHHPAGYFRVSWDGRNRNGRPAASGLYYYQIEVKDSASGMGKRFVEERRMILLK